MSGHYMTTIPPGCTCLYVERRIPGEPHIPSYLDCEPDPRCPTHFPKYAGDEDGPDLLDLLNRYYNKREAA